MSRTKGWVVGALVAFALAGCGVGEDASVDDYGADGAAADTADGAAAEDAGDAGDAGDADFGRDGGPEVGPDDASEGVDDGAPDATVDGVDAVDGVDDVAEGIDPAETPAALALPLGDELASPALPDGVRVRAMSFNLHGGGDAPAEAIAAMFAAQNADVVGLQECPPDYAEPIATAAGLPYHSGGSGVVLLSATPLEDVRSIELPAGRRVVRARTTLDGVTFSVYSAHIGWNADGDAQARALVDSVLAADPLAHLVLVGDFNDEHLSTQNTILEEVLLEAHTVAGVAPGERVSWPAAEFDGSEGSQLIDLVFFRRALPAIVLATEVLALAPLLSDHKPVRADLLFPRADDAPFEDDPFAPRRDPWRALPPEGARPPNLLANPGAEAGLAGWTPLGDVTTTDARLQLAPRSGAAFFVGPEAEILGAGAIAGASQTVDLTGESDGIDAGRGRVYAAAWMALGYPTVTDGTFVSNRISPNDHAEVVLDALDGGGGLLRRTASGRRDPYAWFPWAAAMDLPPGTRAVRYTWLGHQHPWHPGGNDAGFDDLYLGFVALAEPHAVLGRDLVAGGGAEADATTGFEANGWFADADLTFRGLMQFPPWSWSGAGHFFAGGERFPIDPGPDGDAELSQTLDLAAHADTLAQGRLALRWGGRVRTWRAETAVTMSLEILDADGSVWGEVAAPPVVATEWTAVEQRTRIPRGASGVRLRVRAPVAAQRVAAFADELYAIPERIDP